MRETRRIINGDTRTSDDRKVYGEKESRYPSTNTSGESDRIYREYDRKIAAVRNNPFLSSAEKERRIRDLQRERDRKIRKTNGYNRDDKRYDEKNKSNKKYKKHPGKHKGWSKGKGNRHKHKHSKH